MNMIITTDAENPEVAQAVAFRTHGLASHHASKLKNLIVDFLIETTGADSLEILEPDTKDTYTIRK